MRTEDMAEELESRQRQEAERRGIPHRGEHYARKQLRKETSMTRSSATIEAELAAAREENRQLSRRIRRLDDELEAAKIDEANANPHPWLGKKVKQVRPSSSWRKGAGTKTVRGVLQVYGPGKYYRGGDSISRGDLIVVTSSGLSAYRFTTRDGEKPWELDQ